MAGKTGIAPVTTVKAAEYLTDHGYKVSKATVVRMIARGELPAFRTPGGHARVRYSDMDKFIKSRA
jgi:excisionase family DNA binding protein